MSSATPASATPAARRLRTALGGLVIAGGALVATAAPALAAPADTTDSTSEQAAASGTTRADQGYGSTRPGSSASPEALDWKNQEGGGGPSSDPSAIDGQAPTPADQGAPYGEEKGGPEVGGVPLKGTLDSILRAQSILPGAGAGDYA